MNRVRKFILLSFSCLVILNNLTFAQPAPGRCGDGVCDDFEKGRRQLCPQDCPSKESAELPANVNVAAIPAAPNKARIKAEVLNIARTVYANNEVSMLSLKIIDYKNIEGARLNPGEIEAYAYHKNNDVSPLLEIKSGDEIEAVLSLSGDEHGMQWQIREVKINKK